MGRRKALEFLDMLKGVGFAKPNPYPMFPNPPDMKGGWTNARTIEIQFFSLA